MRATWLAVVELTYPNGLAAVEPHRPFQGIMRFKATG